MAKIKTYYAYEIGPDGRKAKPTKVFRRSTDEAAVREARKLLNGHDVEIWRGKRFVLRLQYRRGAKRFTHASGPLSLRIHRELRPVREKVCEACAGTGHAVSQAPTGRMLRAYQPRCVVCGGKGRVPLQK
jgi:hypothetical protein